MRRTALLTAALAAAFAGRAAEPPRVFGAAHVAEVYRVLLDRDALLLESITDVIRQKGIQDGEVLVTAGSVQECTYHYVTSTALKAVNGYKTFKGAAEILNAGGLIAAGEPHLHITLSMLDRAPSADTLKGLPDSLPGGSHDREILRPGADAQR